MTTYPRWFIFLMWSGASVTAQDYCSLVVKVVSPDGRRPGASVYVEEKSGRIQEKDQEFDDVKFCDLGALPVTVKVGEDRSCNQVIVREVPIAWNEPYLLTVTYDPEPCIREHVPPPVPLCTIVFRVADINGRWVGGATIHLSSPTTSRLTTDRYGRASFVARLDADVRGLVTADDKRGDVRFTCTRSELVHEEYIKLANP